MRGSVPVPVEHGEIVECLVWRILSCVELILPGRVTALKTENGELRERVARLER